MNRNLAKRVHGLGKITSKRTVPLWMTNAYDEFAQIFRPYTANISKPKRGDHPQIPLWDMWDGCILYLPRRQLLAPRHQRQLTELSDGCFGHPVLVTEVNIRGFEDGTVQFLPMASFHYWPAGLHRKDPPDCPKQLRGVMFYRGLHDHPQAIQDPKAFDDLLEIAHPYRHGHKRQNNLLYLTQQGPLNGHIDKGRKFHVKDYSSYVRTKKAYSVEYSALRGYRCWSYREEFLGSHWDGWRYQLDHDSFHKVMEKFTRYQGIKYKPKPWLITPRDIWRNFLDRVGSQSPQPDIDEKKSKKVHIKRMKEIDAQAAQAAQAAQGRYKEPERQKSSPIFEAKMREIEAERHGLPIFP